jgi:cytochrome oxidase Cu insertion factor (SCO1/SenC/PrrC family)
MVALLFLAAGLLAPTAAAAFYKQEGRLVTPDGRSREEQNLNYFTDLPVTTHEGEEKRFYSDILKDQVVMISFFYTNCPTAEPDNAKIAEIRGLLGGEKGKDILFVSVSADPERDTPEALEEYAQRFAAGKGWVLLTGPAETMRTINLRLGNRNPDPELHIRVFLLGNLRTGHWIRMNEFAPSPSVAEGLRLLAEE